MPWESDYHKKKCDVEAVLASIGSGTIIGTAVIPMTPQTILGNLHRLPAAVKGVEVYTILNPIAHPFYAEPEHAGRFLNNCWFYGGGDRAVAEKGLKSVTYIPNNAHQAITDLTSHRGIDLFVGTASPMDRHGFLSLSCSAFIEKDLIRAAKRVVLEVNPRAPRSFGDTPVHISQVDSLIEVDHVLPKETIVQPTEVEERIGGYVAELVEDGSTIQMGIGGVPYAVSKFLHHKKDLGVHTEMLTEAMYELYEAGVITNRRKSLHPDKFVCAFAFGTQKLYDFIDDNPSVMVMSGSYTNDPAVIGRNSRMVSINAGLMVDLTGQVCSEAIGVRHYSGTGGQLDTHRGAVQAAVNGLGGKGIISLRSTAKEGAVSKIVPTLPQGSPVTVPRQDLDYVVTEHGVAHLRGRSVRQRALALIAVADPAHRSDLSRQAAELGLL